MVAITVKRNNRIGEIHTNNEGYKFKIIEYKGAEDITIQFLDSHNYIKKTQYSKCKTGQIKNPFHPSVHGIGYLGVMSNGEVPKVSENGKQNREYTTWRNMLKRCYDPKSLERNPTYKGCSVCERWHSFSNFLEDLPKIPNYDYWLNHINEHISLDKDIRGNGSRVYSIDNCIFIPAEINSNPLCLNVDNFKYIIAIEITTGYVHTYENPIFASVNTHTKTSEVIKCCNNDLESANGYIFQWYDVEKDYFDNIQSINDTYKAIIV